MPLPADFPVVPPVPPARVRLFDPATGLMSAEWYDYFRALARFEQRVRARLDTLP